MSELRRCPRCGIEKPLSEWRKDAAQSNGIGTCCKDCQRLWARAYRRRLREQGPRREPPEMRTCSACGLELITVLFFPRNSTHIDGYGYTCRRCQSAYARAR